MPNLLIHESSPYLLQHAHNPVNWYPWCEAAFEKANKEDKPVLVSIGYATCHWCHVMERESFEDEQVADFMNAHFVSIKIDREEYPELDQIYMQAVQLLTGSGGWPLNCFLLPDKRPFIGGTYYPPHPGYNRPSWMHLLQHVHKVFHEKRTQVEEQAEKLMLMIARSGEQFIDQQAIQLPENRNFNWKEFADKFADHFDSEWGGFGQAPKFPGMPSLMLCIELGYYLKYDIFSEHACMTMDKMIMGGIHDAAGGGFARYATDREWRIPHFEKMLYDNAQILEGLGALYQLTGKSHYKSCAEQIVLFLNREMKDDNGLYYSALDADSEGVEGKFYTWTYEELCQLTEGLDQSALFEYYNISKEGNWENNNILFSDQLPEDYANSNQIELNEWENQLSQFHERLMQRRAQRQRPGLDHKVLLSWNALLAEALLLWKGIDNENPLFKNGEQLIEILLDKFLVEGGTLMRVSTDDKVKLSGNLDDYAYLISALIKAEQTTGQQKYITTALKLCEKVNSDFVDSKDKMFYFSSLDTKGLPLRMKEIMDTSMPDAGAIMCKNLWQLGILTGDELFKDHARSLFYQLTPSINKFPSAFSSWARIGLRVDFPFYEIDILGIKKESMLNDIKKEFLPNKLICNRVIHMFEKENFSDKEAPQVLICKENSCELPLDDVSNAIRRLKEII